MKNTLLHAGCTLLALGACSSKTEATAPSVSCDGPPGLYEDGACTVVARDLRPYAPKYPLWADGAEKERLVRLPEGATIDSTDPDNWVFPVDTTLYKTFSIGGKRLETRVLRKQSKGTGVDVWSMRAYAWNEAQNAVVDVTSDEGCPGCAALRENVLGTDHDIPDGTACRQCHRGSVDAVNGFSAIQLQHGGLGVTLKGLIDEGRLSNVGTLPMDAVIPGDDLTRETLGYLHANCGHCHRYDTYRGPDPSSCQSTACLTGLLMWMPVGTKSPEASPLFQTAIGHEALYAGFAPAVTCRILPGKPDLSVLVRRMEARNDVDAMPRIATEHVDPDGVALVRRFVAGLPVGDGRCD